MHRDTEQPLETLADRQVHTTLLSGDKGAAKEGAHFYAPRLTIIPGRSPRHILAPRSFFISLPCRGVFLFIFLPDLRIGGPSLASGKTRHERRSHRLYFQPLLLRLLRYAVDLRRPARPFRAAPRRRRGDAGGRGGHVSPCAPPFGMDAGGMASAYRFRAGPHVRRRARLSGKRVHPGQVRLLLKHHHLRRRIRRPRLRRPSRTRSGHIRSLGDLRRAHTFEHFHERASLEGAQLRSCRAPYALHGAKDAVDSLPPGRSAPAHQELRLPQVVARSLDRLGGSAPLFQGLWAVSWYQTAYGVAAATARNWASLVSVGMFIGTAVFGGFCRRPEDRFRGVCFWTLFNVASWGALVSSVALKLPLPVAGTCGFLIGAANGLIAVQASSAAKEQVETAKTGALLGTMNMIVIFVVVLFQWGTGILINLFPGGQAGEFTERGFLVCFLIVVVLLAGSLPALPPLRRADTRRR